MKLQILILESNTSASNTGVICSHLSTENGYPDHSFSWFSSVPPGKFGHGMDVYFPTCSNIYHSLIIIPFNATLSQLLRESLNKP